MTLPRLGDDDENLSPTQHLSLISEVLARPIPADKEFLSVAIPASIEAPEKFLRLVERENGFLWRAPGGEQFAGGGAAGEVRVSGPDRFKTLSRRVPEFFSRIHSVGVGGVTYPPVLVGGAAFAPGVAPVDPWTEFTEDTFILPRWAYRRSKDDAAIMLTIHRDELGDLRKIARLIEETGTLVRAFEYESPTSMIERVDLSRASVRHMPKTDWNEYIAAVQNALASGKYEKIVAARRCVIDLQRTLEDTSFMARVFAAYPDCIHYAIRRKSSTFLGATPETLFRKSGLHLDTEALAGTTRVSEDPREDSSRDVAELLVSKKDLVEHGFVVERICADLQPLATEISHASGPRTRQVRNLVHLNTPIKAELKPTTTVFDLLGALHPTPAVGGFPTREAAQWLADNEPIERGWFTGTVGWIDATGNGAFAVAIRCGVLSGSRAHIYAGAGIVKASNAEAEYIETGAKMAPILRALGIVF